MSELILSREEVKALYSKHFVNPYDLLPLWAEAFSAALESAILEKLCGEPIYQTRQLSDEAAQWDDVHEATHSACASQPQFYETRIVYALNRSQS
ncbi:hypothetical protein [Burkholderia pseudomultivorans]|uniref:hypothetical protein n=1 Tax=Burkholderia pseudomultivorans TaxID=1207504 RepID=UPI000841E975|nr:hypothetical protein [Burkholderia pseudomultivorans]AOI92076.1 hypothetical protein WS57_25530 [Burkholderia pseudomultivorans]